MKPATKDYVTERHVNLDSRTVRIVPLAALALLLADSPAVAVSQARPATHRAAVTEADSPAPMVVRASPLRYVRRTMRHGDGAAFVAHVLYVNLCDPTVDLRTTAPEEGRRTVSSWARVTGAAAAINGDFFDVLGRATPVSTRRGHPAPPRGAIFPLGPARGDGRDWPARDPFYFGGMLAIRGGEPPEIVDGFPMNPLWTNVIATQERIVVEGRTRLDPNVVHSLARHPRTAIGLTRDRRLLILLVIDGRSRASAGVTTPELGVVLRDLGAWEGLRMDGGGSSALFLEGRGIVNHPSDGHERVVANHFGVVLRPEHATRPAPGFCRE